MRADGSLEFSLTNRYMSVGMEVITLSDVRLSVCCNYFNNYYFTFDMRRYNKDAVAVPLVYIR